jgi:adenylate cyclase, class 2
VEQRRNIELKAVDRDPNNSPALCRKLGAEPAGILDQRDTYFLTPTGRLKLREETGASPHLVSYIRSDRSAARESQYRIVAVEDAEGLLMALADTIGVETVVEKQRLLFFWKEVRIHLDDVKSLGRFIEFEAVAPPTSDLRGEREKVAQLREAFALGDGDLIGDSYCDLLLAS